MKNTKKADPTVSEFVLQLRIQESIIMTIILLEGPLNTAAPTVRRLSVPAVTRSTGRGRCHCRYPLRRAAPPRDKDIKLLAARRTHCACAPRHPLSLPRDRILPPSESSFSLCSPPPLIPLGGRGGLLRGFMPIDIRSRTLSR